MFNLQQGAGSICGTAMPQLGATSGCACHDCHKCRSYVCLPELPLLMPLSRLTRVLLGTSRLMSGQMLVFVQNVAANDFTNFTNT